MRISLTYKKKFVWRNDKESFVILIWSCRFYEWTKNRIRHDFVQHWLFIFLNIENDLFNRSNFIWNRFLRRFLVHRQWRWTVKFLRFLLINRLTNIHHRSRIVCFTMKTSIKTIRHRHWRVLFLQLTLILIIYRKKQSNQSSTTFFFTSWTEKTTIFLVFSFLFIYFIINLEEYSYVLCHQSKYWEKKCSMKNFFIC